MAFDRHDRHELPKLETMTKREWQALKEAVPEAVQPSEEPETRENVIAPRKHRRTKALVLVSDLGFPTIGYPIALRTNTLKNGRASLSRLLRAYSRGLLPTEQAKVLIFGFNTLLAWLRAIEELDLEARIAALEAKTEKKGDSHYGIE
jgi:hypothetical protein